MTRFFILRFSASTKDVGYKFLFLIFSSSFVKINVNDDFCHYTFHKPICLCIISNIFFTFSNFFNGGIDLTECQHNEGRVVPISCAEFDPSCITNPERFHIVLINGGSLQCAIGAQQCFISGPAVLCFSKSALFHHVWSSSLDALHISFAPEFINIHLNWPLILSSEYNALCQRFDYPDFDSFLWKDGLFNNVVIPHGDLFSSLCSDFSAVKEQLTVQPDARWSCRARHFVFMIMNKVKRIGNDISDDTPADRLIIRVQDYVLSHIQDKLSVESLCKEFSTNHTTLYKHFHKTFGMSVSEYIIQRRFEIAKHDLEFGELPLSEISKKAGFISQAYFSRFFKQYIGSTPNQYRRMIRTKRNNFFNSTTDTV